MTILALCTMGAGAVIGFFIGKAIGRYAGYRNAADDFKGN